MDTYVEEVQPGDTKGLIKEYLYRHRSGFFKVWGGRHRYIVPIIKSLFIK